MRLMLDAAAATLGNIDLGEPSDHGEFDEGDLAPTSGNLYLYLDGKEYGSLFFFRRKDGTVTITLGQFDADKQEWVEKAELDHPVEV